VQGMEDVGLPRFVLPDEAGDPPVDIDGARIKNISEANGPK